MALSAAMQWALANGMTEADVYKNINDFLATNPDAATTQAQMAQYGISPQDVAAATGGKSGGMLSGNIMAGASWNSTNTALQDSLTQATGQQTSNYAVGGSTTTDTLNQLNTFLAGGGQFDPNATVYLQAGGVDFIQGVDKGVVKDNLNQIVKTLGDQGVNVVLTGSPYATSVQDVIDNKFNPEVDPLFKEIAKENKNVALVGTQGEILQNKALLVDALHTNAEGTAIYNQSVIDALSQFKNEVPPSTPQAIAEVQKTNTVATTPPVITQAAENKTAVQNQLKNQILSQGTTSQWQGEGKGSAEANAADMAKILAEAGITDISQFGKITKTVDAAVNPVYEYQISGSGEQQEYKPVVVGYTDQNGNAIDPSLVKADTALVGSGENVNYETVYTAPIGKEEVFGNKLTGQAVTNTYGERQTGDAFGGTYTGKGNTAYNVKFDESGKPVFYTTGASSSDTKDIARIIQAGLLLSGAGGVLGGALGLTGAAAQGVGTGLISAGGNALAGGTGSDILKAGLLGGLGAYGGNLLSNMDVPVDFNNMTADQLDEALQSNLVKDLRQAGVTNPSEFLTGQGGNAATYIQESTAATDLAKSLSNSGLNSSQISQLMESVGFAPTAIADAIDTLPLASSTGGLLSSAATTPTTGAVNVTGQAPTTSLPTTVLPSTVTTPTTSAGTVNVTGTGQPQQIDQSVMNLINSQLAANVKTPTTLANVQVTGDKGLMSNADTTNAILSTLAGNITTPTSVTTPTQTITGQKPATTQDIVDAITSTLPSVTQAQASTVAEQVIKSGRPVTTQEVISAITAALPTVTTPTTTTTVPTQTITAEKPSSINDVITAATIPLIQPSTPLTPTPVTSTTDNTLGLTDAQIANLLKAGLGLFGTVGAASALSGGGTTVSPTGLPTQQPPMYTGDYFTKVQQNYNQLLPAVPRDVASPLRDWYLSQYGA